jgi:hypothetical protein
MFHTCVRGLHGQDVDFDSAAWLMDRELLEEAKALREGETRSPRDPDTMAQRVWNTYCALHREKYGITFQPDLDPTWDRPHLSGLDKLLALFPERCSDTETAGDSNHRYGPEDIRLLGG